MNMNKKHHSEKRDFSHKDRDQKSRFAKKSNHKQKHPNVYEGVILISGKFFCLYVSVSFATNQNYSFVNIRMFLLFRSLLPIIKFALSKTLGFFFLCFIFFAKRDF